MTAYNIGTPIVYSLVLKIEPEEKIIEKTVQLLLFWY